MPSETTCPLTCDYYYYCCYYYYFYYYCYYFYYSSFAKPTCTAIHI